MAHTQGFVVIAVAMLGQDRNDELRIIGIGVSIGNTMGQETGSTQGLDRAGVYIGGNSVGAVRCQQTTLSDMRKQIDKLNWLMPGEPLSDGGIWVIQIS